ncbi:hypothetical protein E0J21_34495 [Rhizobium laguerreae]|nr:hypothetical protein E0J21_34495 [Rhizobium laguerreae]
MLALGNPKTLNCHYGLARREQSVDLQPMPHGWQSELLGMPAAGSIIVRQVISGAPKNQWYVMETAKRI